MLSTNGSTQHLYLDGVEDLNSVTNTDDNIDYTRNNYVIGRSAGVGSHWNGDMADYIFDDTYIDLSVVANREKFILDGAPVDPGSDGATAVGASPLIYLNQNTLSTWHTNAGTGGGFTENGALTAGTTVTKAINGNHFTPNGTITDTADSPTDGDSVYGDYATFNPLFRNNTTVPPLNFTTPPVYSNGNRTAVIRNAWASVGTISINSGKWYWEMTLDAGPHASFGWGNDQAISFDHGGQVVLNHWFIDATGAVGTEAVYVDIAGGSGGEPFGDGDVIGFAVDFDNDAVWCSKGGVWMNSATEAEIEAGTTTNALWTGELAGQMIRPMAFCYGGTSITSHGEYWADNIQGQMHLVASYL